MRKKKKILNLVDRNKSEILYYTSKYPDGQQDFYITGDLYNIKEYNVIIHSRMNSWLDIEMIILANQSLKESGCKDISLYSPSFLGSRSDRKFKEGGVNYLKSVICPIINSQGFSEVVTLDPHSDVLEACLNNYGKINNFNLVKNSLAEIDNKNGAQDRIVLVSPDGGALKKIFDVAEEFKIPNIVTAMKHRDIQTGKITHTEVPNLSNYGKDHKFVIIDDICDGGRTFIELAKEIRKQNETSEIFLVVTHGVFSNGLYELSKCFTKIYTTNSYRDCNVEEDSDYTVSDKFLKQFTVI